ncbi:glycoside hydrolase family 27 protein [Microbacterium hominis]|uniref:Alpha-galactosidase n=1 Tax=Microbacterium hominis TaxID=162426 RepID=A0A7D4Q4C6_9MICO|nr:glycoside hydrolase family 27 protein [Microbacterium hominis]QKJ20591.1 glycoside hydrolase family 27 protein [Microbacterium hominis]
MTLRTASTPPLGWNSWDSYGTTITEDEVLANARFLAEHLLPHGWDTVVIDADWSDPTPRTHGYTEDAQLNLDAHGRLIPDPVRFPSSAGGAGFGPLAARLHEMGLKLGIHIMRGIPKRAVALDLPVAGTDLTAAQIADLTNLCEWNPHYSGLAPEHAGDYYRSLIALYDQWGIDFIKADDLLWPYQAADIEALSAAIEASPREISLSLSPGRHLSAAHLDHLRAHSTMWRVCDDVWDRWIDVEENFSRLARWAPFAGEGGWPDADMLPLGRIGLRAERGDPRHDLLTPGERRSMVTLWCIARSPLMVGGDLPTSDPATIALLQNDDVLALLRSANSRELLRERDLVVWAAEGADGERWVAVFNLSDEHRVEPFDTRSLGLGPAPARIVEVWTGSDASVEAVHEQSNAARSVAPGSSVVRADLAPHGCVLWRA